jgi:hypothetical protein
MGAGRQAAPSRGLRPEEISLKPRLQKGGQDGDPSWQGRPIYLESWAQPIASPRFLFFLRKANFSEPPGKKKATQRKLVKCMNPFFHLFN